MPYYSNNPDTHRELLKVPCPVCDALPGWACHNSNNAIMNTVHKKRRAIYEDPEARELITRSVYLASAALREQTRLMAVCNEQHRLHITKAHMHPPRKKRVRGLAKRLRRLTKLDGIVRF